MRQVRGAVAARGAHAARTVVLLPFIHLLQPAREAWAAEAGSGFAPRIETTRTLAQGRGFEPGPMDFAHDPGRDLLVARALLEQAGLASRAELLAGHVVEAAAQLAPLAAAVPPGERGAWTARARSVAAAMDAGVLALEAAVAGVAIEWVAASGYATDALHDGMLEGVELLVAVAGLRPDPLAEALVQRMRDAAVRLPLELAGERGVVSLQAAADAADEAERAAACVLRHVEAGRVPVALPALDRVLTRRIRAMLEQRGVAVRDETGWKLSTTRAGAHVMLALRACRRDAATDAVVDWLKNAPQVHEASTLALERRVRRAGVREWRNVGPQDLGEAQQRLHARVEAWRESLQASRALPQWLEALRALLRDTGQWDALVRDAAGARVVDALRLAEGDEAELGLLPQAARRMQLGDFTRWVDECLEGASFVPPAAGGEHAVILPLAQLLGRAFEAVVLAGCDEKRLPAAPEPAGSWTATQRAALGLPARAMLEAEQRAAWQYALQAPHVDVLWRSGDEGGETLMASPLVQAPRAGGGPASGTDPRVPREVLPQPVQRPLPTAPGLPLERLSASAYDDLRHCPYRFFARRQLGLQEPDEIDQDLDKRDFGNWLHQVLRTFHERWSAAPGEPAGRAALLDAVAQEVMRQQRLGDDEFLPFRAAWPQVRDGYLAWLDDHERSGAVFAEAEAEHERALASVRLFGRIDRIDSLAGGGRFVIDYKTESSARTKERVAAPGEDTQLAFYAALLPGDGVRAAYVNVGERGETKLFEQQEVQLARDLLVAGIEHDLARIAGGARLEALGEGIACEYCAARGLCRRDWWE